MGSLYHLGQKFIDFCKSVNQIEDNALSVPTSHVVYEDTLSSKGTLPTNTDLNSLIRIGAYTLSGSNTYPNIPDGVTFGMLEVARGRYDSVFIAQRLSHVGNGREYFRDSSNGGTSWSAWREVANVQYVESKIPHTLVQLGHSNWSGLTATSTAYDLKFFRSGDKTWGILNGYINLTGVTTSSSTISFKLTGTGLSTVSSAISLGYCFIGSWGSNTQNPTSQNIGAMTRNTDGSISCILSAGTISNGGLTIRIPSVLIAG